MLSGGLVLLIQEEQNNKLSETGITIFKVQITFIVRTISLQVIGNI